MNTLISIFLFIIYRTIFITVRVEEITRPKAMVDSLQNDDGITYAHWHGHEWLLFGIWRNRHMTVLSSHSKQGKRMALFMTLMGFNVFRGSSSKGGIMGLRQLVTEVKKTKSAGSLAVDGPRGPRFEVKSGVVQLARLTRTPIIPVSASCSRYWVIKKAWNKAKIPKPFSKIKIIYGPPIFELSEVESTRVFLQDQMLKMNKILKCE